MQRRFHELERLGQEITRLGTEKLASARHPGDIAAMMAEIATSAEEGLEKCLTAEESGAIVCRAGCTTCCVLNVSTLIPEGIAILAYLQEHLIPESFDSLSEALSRLSLQVRWLDDRERISAGILCAFLDKRGWCLIHPVRPLLCRSVSSTDAGLCHAALVADEEEDAPAPMNLFQNYLMSTVFLRVCDAMEANGHDSRSFELMRLLTNLIDKPAMADQFLQRKRLAVT